MDLINSDSCEVSVEPACGPVIGEKRGGCLRFLGIPYAKAPAGMLRFAAPQKRARFERPFLADAYGKSAPQRRSLPEPLARLFGQASAMSEDCLNLNVWTPDVTGKRPVFVFIHGGAFVIGSGAQYPGDDLALRGDCVVVTMNYRLGPIGFNAFSELFADDERFAANAGILDQRLALAWVQENIEAFGGDPDRVTLAGESAGAASAVFHLVTERSKPLFSQAIVQSGGLNLLYPRDHAAGVADRLLGALGARSDRERLFQLPIGFFSSDLRDEEEGTQLGVVSRPHVDGDEIPDLPIAEIYNRMKPCPLMVGTNRDEFSFFAELPLFPLDSSKQGMDGYVEWIAGPDRAKEVSAVYRDDKAGRIAYGTDLLFRMPAIHLADLQSERAPTYMYRLDWAARGVLSRLGATHSVDLPLLFEDFLKPFRSVYLGVLPDHRRNALSIRMRNHWLSFVRQGHPGEDWPAYETGQRETKIFNLRDGVAADPERVHRIVWQGVDGWTQ